MSVDQISDSTATRPQRRRLPDERRAITHHSSVGGQEGYVTVGLYEDGQPGEVFIKMAKEGSTVSGLMDSFATAVSLALQYGVRIQVLCDKFSHMRFEPQWLVGQQPNRLRQIDHGLPVSLARPSFSQRGIKKSF